MIKLIEQEILVNLGTQDFKEGLEVQDPLEGKETLAFQATQAVQDLLAILALLGSPVDLVVPELKELQVDFFRFEIFF